VWSNYEYIWPNVQHNLPNVCAFHQMRSHLAIVGKFDQMRSERNWPNACAFGQTLHIWSKKIPPPDSLKFAIAAENY